MIDARFDGSFEGWRDIARGLLEEGVGPRHIAWSTGETWQPTFNALSGAKGSDIPRVPPPARSTVPRRFLQLADAVSCHRDPERWALLYDVLWRLSYGEPHLLEVVTDPEVHRLITMERAVRRASHKMKAFVRFRAVQAADDTRTGVERRGLTICAPDGDVLHDLSGMHASATPRTNEPGDRPAFDPLGSEVYVAWFEPMHDVVVRTAPFFARRFPSMRWSILTPDRCAHWDGSEMQFTPGVSRREAPDPDAMLEELWCTYYAHIFNPARLMPDAMRAEMPVTYWRNLPEATRIADLMRDAPHRVARMIEQSTHPPASLPPDLARDTAHERCDAALGEGTLSGRTLGGHAPAARPWSAKQSRAARDLDAPGAQDPHHDPGVAVARARAMRVERALGQPIAAEDGVVRVGVAGWTDPDLVRPGVFYPDAITTAEGRLRYYASRFPMVEVDATYYALPVRSVVAEWVARTPPGFVFDVKAHALMTGHSADVRLLPDWLRRHVGTPPSGRVSARDLPPELLSEVWERFLGALAPLVDAGKLGAVLLQYPRWFTPSRASADALALARARLGDVIGAVEFRHRDWFAGRLRDRTLRLLERLGFAHVIADAPPGTESSVPLVVAQTSPALCVVRLHGRRTDRWEARNNPASDRYRYLYDSEELAEWLPRIIDVAKAKQGVHVVFNNCHANYGTTNADEITEMLIDANEERRRMGREARRAQRLPILRESR